MVQFECPRVIFPLVSFTFGVHCSLPFFLYAGKGKCCMWPVKKVEIHLCKIRSMDSKWSNLNAPESYTWFRLAWLLLKIKIMDIHVQCMHLRHEDRN